MQKLFQLLTPSEAACDTWRSWQTNFHKARQQSKPSSHRCLTKSELGMNCLQLKPFALFARPLLASEKANRARVFCYKWFCVRAFGEADPELQVHEHDRPKETHFRCVDGNRSQPGDFSTFLRGRFHVTSRNEVWAEIKVLNAGALFCYGAPSWELWRLLVRVSKFLTRILALSHENFSVKVYFDIIIFFTNSSS